MHNISIQVIDNLGLTEREKIMLQTTILNFAAMTNAIITGEGLALNPLENDAIGIILVFPKALNSEVSTELMESLKNKLSNYFKMCNLELEAKVKLF